MKRHVQLALVVLLTWSASTASSDAVFDDESAWLAAVASKGLTPTPVNLTSVTEVPDTGATYVNDDLTLVFPGNHGEMAVYANGWVGDVHSVGGVHEPFENLVFLSQPVIAFGTTAWVAWDFDEDEHILVFIGGSSYALDVVNYDVASPTFWGWVGEDAVTDMTIRSGSGNHFYSFRDVRLAVVPEPGAAALGMISIAGLLRQNRRLKHLREERNFA